MIENRRAVILLFAVLASICVMNAEENANGERIENIRKHNPYLSAEHPFIAFFIIQGDLLPAQKIARNCDLYEKKDGAFGKIDRSVNLPNDNVSSYAMYAVLGNGEYRFVCHPTVEYPYSWSLDFSVNQSDCAFTISPQKRELFVGEITLETSEKIRDKVTAYLSYPISVVDEGAGNNNKEEKRKAITSYESIDFIYGQPKKIMMWEGEEPLELAFMSFPYTKSTDKPVKAELSPKALKEKGAIVLSPPTMQINGRVKINFSDSTGEEMPYSEELCDKYLKGNRKYASPILVLYDSREALNKDNFGTCATTYAWFSIKTGEFFFTELSRDKQYFFDKYLYIETVSGKPLAGRLPIADTFAGKQIDFSKYKNNEITLTVITDPVKEFTLSIKNDFNNAKTVYIMVYDAASGRLLHTDKCSKEDRIVKHSLPVGEYNIRATDMKVQSPVTRVSLTENREISLNPEANYSLHVKVANIDKTNLLLIRSFLVNSTGASTGGLLQKNDEFISKMIADKIYELGTIENVLPGKYLLVTEFHFTSPTKIWHMWNHELSTTLI